MHEFDSDAVRQSVQTIKTLAIDAVQKANSGHPGTPMGLAAIAFELWAGELRHDPKDPQWLRRDRFVLSAGHASMLLYSLLHLSGYDLSLDDLKAFRQWGSKTPGHPEYSHTAGVETTTGPLGQGVGNAVGFALAVKMSEARFGAPFEGIRVFAVASDGDLMEGVSSEASSIAGHLKLDNLTLIYDDNRITIEGGTALAFTEDVGKRYEAYGWFVQHIDGHDHTQIREALRKANAESARPSLIVARTHIAEGAPHAVDTAEAHGSPLGADEIALVKKGMGLDPDKQFYVPQSVRDLFAARAKELHAEREADESRLNAWKKENPDRAAELENFLAKTVPTDLYEQLLKAVPPKDEATRNLSNAMQQVIAKAVPSFVGGAADLAPSTKTLIKDGGNIAPGKFEGRNLHFGIREHAMGAVCNGLALFGGFIPYGATFLIFSDYMRPSVRLSALMKQQCVWIYTHDSVFLGEDGPTHQPVEHLASLRLVPGLRVIRPADALEVAAAWTIALESPKAPTAFALTRQKLPPIARDATFKPRDAMRGMYIAQEAKGGTPDLVILASGSELHLATGAKTLLEEAGRKVRVVSALCLELFLEQDAGYREQVILKGVRCVSVEAGRTDPWRSWVGENGLCLGIDRFGASAPDTVLAEKFGFTVNAVTKAIQAWLA